MTTYPAFILLADLLGHHNAVPSLGSPTISSGRGRLRYSRHTLALCRRRTPQGRAPAPWVLLPSADLAVWGRYRPSSCRRRYHVRIRLYHGMEWGCMMFGPGKPEVIHGICGASPSGILIE